MLLVLGLRNGERVDVVTAAGKQADDPRQHAWLVVHQDRQGMGLDLLRHRGGGIMGGGVHFALSHLPMSSPALTGRSILVAKMMDARVKPAHDGRTRTTRST